MTQTNPPVTEEAVERIIRDLAKQLYAHHVVKYDPEAEEYCIRAAIAALKSPPVVSEGMIAVPLDAPEVMWDGLPRAIMLWLGFERPTPRSLFKHLKSSGYDIPAWMQDEGELKALDHVPSKGTRCVIIYRAMIENHREALAMSVKSEATQGEV